MTTGSATRPVLVVIPVYGNFEATRRCLDSLIASDLPDHVSVLLIDDHSPDESLSALCRDVTRRSGYELLVNEQNLGFVASANQGFEYDVESDVILLNSDTAVSDDWISRLQACAYRQEKTGTVTPFTNNGTICSYPAFNMSNPLPVQWTAAELDELFAAANDGQSCEIPTAVGFCMYVKRTCLNDTGLFDAERFGQGYGEECDFCLRARHRGWKHMVAADVFVFHEGAASFATESEERKREADRIIEAIHPQYNDLVEEFLRADPLRRYRDRVDASRLAKKPDDCMNLLDERQRYVQHLREKTTAELTGMRKLAEARSVVDQLNGTVNSLSREIVALNSDNAELRQELQEERIRRQGLSDRIRLMEQSRSWRYTAWLRRE